MMKKLLCVLMSAFMLIAACACGNNPADNSNSGGGNSSSDEITVTEGYTVHEIEAGSGYEVGGYGAQIDTDQFMPFNNLTDEERTMLKTRISEMNVQYTRIKMFGEYFEMANDNDDPNVFDYDAAGVFFDSTEMKALYEVLDLCEENGIKVDLSWYNCNSTFKAYDQTDENGKLYQGTWMGYSFDETNTWCTAPRMTETFDGYAEQAENIAVCLDYLINKKNYTCIYGFSFIAEGFYSPNGIVWDEYVRCCDVINKRLIKDGLKDKVIFIGTSNESKNMKMFEELQTPLKDIFDIGGFGLYHWDLSDLKTNRYTQADYFENLKAVCDRLGYDNFAVPEFCTHNRHSLNATTWDDVEDYDAALWHATLVIDAAKYGFTTLNHYIIGDTYFTNSYVHTMGLWMYRDNGWKAHPAYYVWAMVCKYTDVGAKVYNIDFDREKDVMTMAFLLPEGGWTYLAVNFGDKTEKVAFVNQNENKPGKVNLYRLTESAIPENRVCETPDKYDEENGSDGVVYLKLSPMSLTVVSTR